MLTLLVSLLVIYQRLRSGQTPVSALERWAVNGPFSVYLGWITVATIANFTSVLDYVKWNGFGIDGATWAVIMLVVALVVAGLMAYTRGDVAFLLVLVWAFAGIGVSQAASALVSNAAYVAAVVAAIFAAGGWILRRRSGPALRAG